MRGGQLAESLRLVLVSVWTLSCTAPLEPPTVRFEVDAPFCVGTPFPLRFSIDGSAVGEDTLMDGDASAEFETTAGAHTLLAEFLTVPTERDTTVTLGPGDRFRMALDFYCS